MKITDIDDAIFTRLEANFPTMKLYGDEVKKGFVRPSFYVETIPVINSMYNTDSNEKVIMIKIHYFSEDETNIENYNMADELAKVFRSHLPVLNLNLHILNVRTNIQDMVLYFTFDLIFFDSFDEENQVEPEKMQEIHVRNN